MSPIATVVMLASICGLAAIAILTYVRTKSWRGPGTALVVLCAITWALHRAFGFPKWPPSTVGRGEARSELPMIIALFLCMIAGMLAQWLQKWLETPKAARAEFDIGTFVAPIFGSPIVFIPLLASLQNANLDLSSLDVPRFMVLLVAFENGFFWKDYFDNRRRKMAEPQ